MSLFASPLSAEEVSLAGEWRFTRDEGDVGEQEQWHTAEFDDSGWEIVSVPASDWGDFDGLGWYRTSVSLPDAETVGDRTLYLVFDGVDDESRVWVDGDLVAQCNSWNRKFFADLSDRAGDEVVIAVRVKDNGMGGGIHGAVNLVITADRGEVLASEWHEQEARTPPDYLPGSEVYSVFVRNFSETGDFEGLRQRIPELRELGVDILWLMPITPIGVEARKGSIGSPYAIYDHLAINPDFGTAEDFRRLVETVHANGMRIIIDAVFNHSSPDAPLAQVSPELYLQDENGRPRANNPDWYDIVAFDWSKPEVADYFYGVLEYWVREFDIDGYRCDVASMMPTPFWEEGRRRLEAIKPDIMMLAESDAPDLHPRAFDLSYNWTLWDAMTPVIASGEQPPTAIEDAMLQDFYTFPRGSLRMTFAENHDKQRAVTQFGGIEQAKVAALITLTITSVPMLFNGQEVGISWPRDIFEYQTIDWSDPHQVRPYFQRILSLRASSEALRLGDLNFLDLEPQESVLSFTRQHNGETALVIANVTREEVTVPMTEVIPLIGPGAVPSDLGVARWDEEGTEVTLAPHSGDVWVSPGLENLD